MIKLSFVLGSSLRRVIINQKKISLASQETGFTPISIDLDKLDNNKHFNELDDKGKKLLEECKKLKTEEEIARDIIKDFQGSGWRCIKRDGDI